MRWGRIRAVATATTLGLLLGAVGAPAGPPSLGAAPAGAVSAPSAFHAVAPTRLADTRRNFGTTPVGRLAAGATLSVQITNRSEIAVPSDAVAVVLNVTAAAAGGIGYLTVSPHGAPTPEASNLNPTGAGFVGANLVTVRLAQGAVDVYSSVASDVIVDLAGYYSPSGATAAGRLVPVTPNRQYDSRPSNPVAAGESRTLALTGLPPTAQAAVLNVTAVHAAAGFWSVLQPGTPLGPDGLPSTSSLNVSTADSTVASQVIVPIGADHRIVLYASAGGHVLIDLFGYVTNSSAATSSDGLFVALDAPFRILDTRTTNSPLNGNRTWPGWTIEVDVTGRGGVPDSGVAAIAGNLTSVDPHDAGFVASFPAGTTFPGTSSLNNDAAGTVVPNHVLTPISGRGVSVLAAAGGHLLLDVAGYFLGSATPATVPVPVNVMPIPSFPLQISIPTIGLNASVQQQAEKSDLVRGPGWWPGTSYPGVAGNMAIFGHRTEATAPFNRLNRLRAGDTVILRGDHRTSVYVVQGWQVVPAARAEEFVGATNDTRLTLIACSRPDGTPTSLSYRIIVTATLQSYTDN